MRDPYLTCVASPIALKPSSQVHTPWQSDTSANRGVLSSPYGNRTRDSAVKGQRLNPLSNGPLTVGPAPHSELVLCSFKRFLSGTWDSNPQPPAWKASALINWASPAKVWRTWVIRHFNVNGVIKPSYITGVSLYVKLSPQNVSFYQPKLKKRLDTL